MTNPFLDAAIGIEIGARARDALMSARDWGDILDIFLHHEKLHEGTKWEYGRSYAASWDAKLGIR